MKYKRITKAKAIEFLANSKTGTESVWFKTNSETDYSHNGDNIGAITVNGKCTWVYNATDAGKVCFRYDSNGNKVGIYGYDECKVAYILAD